MVSTRQNIGFFFNQLECLAPVDWLTWQRKGTQTSVTQVFLFLLMLVRAGPDGVLAFLGLDCSEIITII